jgi:hypothetical protein
MDLTPKNKTYIDSLPYNALLSRWRFAPVGDSMFQGETGDYWGKRLAELRDKDPDGHVRASKNIGWSR